MKEVTNQSDCQKLQDDLNKIFSWAEENHMGFNSNKFELMRIMRYIVRKNRSELGNKTEEGSAIARKNYIVYLGVVISDTAKFHEQNKKAAANR